MLEERDDLIDRVLHPVELAKRGIAPDDPVTEDPPEVLIVASVDELRFTDSREHALGSRCIGRRVLFAQLEIILEP